MSPRRAPVAIAWPTGFGAHPGYAGADALRGFLQSEADRWGQVMRGRGITAD